MSKRWVCSKCGETAISKCPYSRTVFPSDQQAAVMSHVYSYDIKFGPQGQYIDNQVQATISLGYVMLVPEEQARAMTDIDLPYINKPYPPTCRVGPKPVEPEWLTPKKARTERGMDPATYKQFKAWYKEAKAEYERKIAEWEEAMLRHHVAMAKYNEQFKAWCYYEENKERVWAHNKKTRHLRKEFLKANLEHILGIRKESLEHWLCDHHWLLDSEELTSQPCSLGTCMHATIGMMKKDRTDFGNKEG